MKETLDLTVTVTVTLSSEEAKIEGPHGKLKCRAVDPLEIGIRVLEVATGHVIAPVERWPGRKEDS